MRSHLWMESGSPPCSPQTQHRGRKAEIQFSTVDFGGELAVKDAVRLTEALCAGVGRAKAFGCGLLLVRPVG